jgi:hypothetical protein
MIIERSHADLMLGAGQKKLREVVTRVVEGRTSIL